MIRRKISLELIATLPLVWSLSGCGGGGGAGTQKTPPPAPPVVKEDGAKTTTPPGDSAKAEGKKDAAAPVGAAEGWGTIKGRVVFSGTAPQPVILVKQGDEGAKDAAVCAVKGVVSEEFVVNSDNNGLKWVVVYLGGKPKVHADLAKAEGVAELGQENCHFIPHVLAMRHEQKLKVTSNDPVGHNTNLQPFKNPPWNQLLPPAPPNGKTVLEGPDLMAETRPITVACNVHSWMKAYICVFEHPYYAVTDDRGTFEIKNVPAGTQKLVVWQEKIGYGEGKQQGKEIAVKADETTDLGDIAMKLP